MAWEREPLPVPVTQTWEQGDENSNNASYKKIKPGLLFFKRYRNFWQGLYLGVRYTLEFTVIMFGAS